MPAFASVSPCAWFFPSLRSSSLLNCSHPNFASHCLTGTQSNALSSHFFFSFCLSLHSCLPSPPVSKFYFSRQGLCFKEGGNSGKDWGERGKKRTGCVNWRAWGERGGRKREKRERRPRFRGPETLNINTFSHLCPLSDIYWLVSLSRSGLTHTHSLLSFFHQIEFPLKMKGSQEET